MTSNIHQLFQSVPTDSIGMANVLEAKNGQATMINLDGVSYPVTAHLSQVEMLKTGDRVMTIRTATEVIVAGRLRAGDESPAPRLEERDGHLLVEAPTSIRLQAGQNRIEVHADGRILLDGKQITGLASGRMRLQGSTIELN